ncbi:GntR family transcriptional regulator [Coraliomargarita sp. SDUM461004]|uniref:GntR family transcriptional regulator n=1 Tax=Thalassobacterium sedimentorum TaxID=3041258 RepID=A0ABU1ALM4_9BACT|nr:GntR family transcriptional regulator [Coraliomargarita sp. SDUM461004]MDQ8195705.1 GntR family transcriptional regulator [Coraliomargarita sp. SDUM461004]
MKKSLPPFVRDSASSLPLHRQVEQWLRLQIEAGGFMPGDALPPRKEFCKMLGGINHLTIRQGVNALIRDGLLFSIPGRGIFVAERKGKPLSVGVVLPSIDDEFTHALVASIQDVFAKLSEEGESLIRPVLFDSRRDAQQEIDSISHLMDLPLDGAIVFPVDHGDMLEKLVQLKVDNFPLVLVGWVPGIKFNSVTSDDYAGAFEATSYLLRQGRQRLAWIGNRKSVYSVASRFEGFRDALSDHGVLYDRKLLGELVQVSPTMPIEDSLSDILDHLLAQDPRPDAFVCVNDYFALACIKELAKRNIRVPEDISIVGYDDIKAAANGKPSLTTVRNPMRELGEAAAELLVECIHDSTRDPEEIVLPVNLIVRDSAG